MCFSPEASFGAAAIIGIVGVVSLKKASTFSQRAFAVIPLFFAIQQLIEGFLWLVLAKPEYLAWKQMLIDGFLIFAWMVWPVYIPFSMSLLEKNDTRRKVLLVFLGMGFFLILCFLYILIFHHPDASAAKLHIKYTFDYVPPLNRLWGILYLVPTVVSILISTVKKMWVLGIINLASYVFSVFYFSGHVLSVWCFFGALASVFVLCFIILMNKTPGKKINQTWQ